MNYKQSSASKALGSCSVWAAAAKPIRVGDKPQTLAALYAACGRCPAGEADAARRGLVRLQLQVENSRNEELLCTSCLSAPAIYADRRRGNVWLLRMPPKTGYPTSLLRALVLELSSEAQSTSEPQLCWRG